MKFIGRVDYFYAAKLFECLPKMTVRKLFLTALHNVICFNLIFFFVSQDCENLLKRFLVLNPTKRSRLEVGIFTVVISLQLQKTLLTAAVPICVVALR